MHARQTATAVVSDGTSTDPQAPARPETHLFSGLRHTTLVVATALAGCGLLVIFGATLSVCWMIHPLLFAAFAAGLVWAIRHVAPHLFRTPDSPSR